MKFASRRWPPAGEAAFVAFLGALQTLAFVHTQPWLLPLLPIATLALLVWRLDQASPRRAALLGLGPSALRHIAGRFRKVEPGNVALVGIRSVDDGERSHLLKLGVHVYTMADIDRHGIHVVMEKALANVTDGTHYVHVSFDLDSVDPALAPGVGTPVKGGLDYREAHLVMESLSDAGVMTSLEMVEVNPILDDRNRSAEFAVELVQSAFGKQIL